MSTMLRVHGARLVASDAERVRVYDLSSGAPVLLAERADPGELNAFQPDAAGERLSRLCEGRFARSLTAPGQPGHWAGKRSTVVVYDLVLDELARFETDRLDDRSLALSPDAGRVASVSRGAGVIVFDADSGATLASFPGDIASGVAWSPDGRWIAAGDTDQGGGALYLLDTQASDPAAARRTLPEPSSGTPLYDSPYESVFSPDGRFVAFASAAWGTRGVTVYEVASGTECWSVDYPMAGEDEEPEFWNALELDFAAGGAVLLAGLEDGLRAWRTSDGTPLSTLACDGASGLYFASDDARRCVWFERDGELVSEPWPADWS